MTNAITLEPRFETGVTGNGGLRYNIQMARASDGVWHQRHIWHRDQLGEHIPPCVGPWIVSIQSGPGAHYLELAQ